MEDKDIRYVGSLVRDRIPEILRREGNFPMTRTLDDEEYLYQLHVSLKHAIEVYMSQRSVADLSDVLEIIEAIAEMRGVTDEEIVKIRNYRAMTFGTYHNRLFLEKMLTPEEKKTLDKEEEEAGFDVQF
ncbi:MAG: nucleoside triphosphate pyrophosphohydrolase [Firmicutes bacterium]|nr:nucleoside triphosphate pyrophosphohydrolase [Bacillota bacterium]